MPNANFGPHERPLAIDGVETAVLEGEAVLFREDVMMMHRIGAFAGSVWLMCDGDTSVGEIAADLAEPFETPADELIEIVVEVLAALAAEGLLVGHQPHNLVLPPPETGVAPDGTAYLLPPPNP